MLSASQASERALLILFIMTLPTVPKQSRPVHSVLTCGDVSRRHVCGDDPGAKTGGIYRRVFMCSKNDRLSHLLCHVQLRVPHVVIFRRTLPATKKRGNLTFRGHNSTSLLPMRETPSTRNVWCLLPVFGVGAVHGLNGFAATRGTVLGLHLQTPLRR